MPTYDYHCQSCGARFEVWQKMSDEPVQTCPTCGGPVHRVLHPAGILFKGAGFYSTDSRAPSADASAADGSSNGSSGDGKGDGAKPADGKSGATSPAPAAAPSPSAKGES